jgi:hypothetical protein
MTLNCSSSAIEPTLRYQRGVQGFLEYQELMNSRLRTAFTPLTERAEAEFGLFLENVMQRGTLATACEIAVRASEKAAKLGRKLAEEPYGGRAVELNEAALAAAQRARYFLKESLQNIDDPDNQIAKAFGSDVATERIALARREMFHELVEINTKPADFEELMQIWDETAKAAGSLEMPCLLSRRQHQAVHRRTRRGRPRQSPAFAPRVVEVRADRHAHRRRNLRGRGLLRLVRLHLVRSVACGGRAVGLRDH